MMVDPTAAAAAAAAAAATNCCGDHADAANDTQKAK